MNKKSLFLSLGVVILCALWLLSGVFKSDASSEKDLNVAQKEALHDQESKAFKVSVMESVAQNFAPDITITGQSKASRTVDIKSEISASVIELAFEKGARVKKGDVLVRLDVDERQARLAEAEQLLRQKQIEYNAAIELEKKGFSPRVLSAQRRSELEGARASVKSAKLALENVAIVAPFDGVIDRQFVEVGDFLSVGQNIFTLVDMNPLEFTVFASEAVIDAIEMGDTAKVALASGQTLEGTVSYVAVTAEPASRTFPVEVQMPNPDLAFREGLTASITLKGRPIQAHQIPTSALVLNTEGDIGVRTVNAENMVVFTPVAIAQNMNETVWVSGLADSATIIVRGQDFVTDGDRVEPQIIPEDGMQSQ